MSSLQSGSTLQGGKYKVECVLGQGGFGITYLANQTMLNRKVAIKEFFYKEFCNRNETNSTITIISKGGEDTVRKFLAKFLKEARTIAALKHPNIIEVYDVFEENGTAYYVMDFIEGETLTDLIKRQGKIDEDTALLYIKKVASALSFIHEKHINHLDIKPSNIMLRKSDNEIILIDFGMAKHYDVTTGDGTTTTPIGISPGYAPLEQYRQGGVSSFTPESDIYSLGATLFKLVTGQTPPEASILLEEGGIGEITGVSNNISRAISTAMQTSKSRRPHSIKEFLSLLATTEKTEDKTILEENITSSIKNPVNAPTKAKPLPSQEIHWDTEDPSKLDLEWHNKIAMISKGVLCGSIFFILLAIMNFTEISGFIVSVPLLFSSIIGIKGGLGIKKRKPDSIFLCLIFSCISATVMLIDSALIISSGSFPGFINLALFTYSLACACAIFNSDDVKIVFPTEYRRITAIDKILAAISIITVLLLVGAAITYA